METKGSYSIDAISIGESVAIDLPCGEYEVVGESMEGSIWVGDLCVM